MTTSPISLISPMNSTAPAAPTGAPATSPAPVPTGVVLFAHGSRDPLWRLPIEAVAQDLRIRHPSTPVACAYLELCEPALPQAVAELLARGVRRVRILPVFFGMGKHAREDLPELVRELAAAHPDIDWVTLPPAGEHPALTRLLADLGAGTLPD